MKFNKILAVLFFLVSLAVFVGYTFFYNSKGDTVPPVIHVSDEPFACSIEATEEELLEGITASDDQDGDLTDKIFVESIGNFIEENTRILSVAVIDQAGNAAKGKRILVYDDYTSPRFSMSGPLSFSIGTREITENIHVEDKIDGDISAKVTTCSPYHLSYNSGDYQMEFMVSNSAGDISKFKATVTLEDRSNPTKAASISLSDYLIYTPKGEKVSAWQYVDGISMNGHEYKRKDKQLVRADAEMMNWTDLPEVLTKSDFKIDDGVNYDEAGCYEIEISYNNGDYSGMVRLVVIVE